MGRNSKRNLLATAEETLTPPPTLSPTEHIARITSAAGNNLYHISYADSSAALVEMPAKFRSKIWVKKGTYVVIDTETLGERENKLGGGIVNIVRDERGWRKMAYWPDAFRKKQHEEQEGNAGMMPPSESEDEEDV